MALPQTTKIRLREKNILTDDVVDFIFDLLEPNTIEFQAGQFVLIKINHPETGELISRAYSMANPPYLNREVILNIEILPKGKLTSLMKAWELGKEVDMQGPFGHFTFKSGPEKNVVFVGTGTGIAPLRSMIEDLLEKDDARPMHLYFGVRHQGKLFYQNLFDDLTKRHPNFSVTYCLSRPEEGWNGFTGRVTAALETLPFDISKTDVYLCGGKPMIDDAKTILTEKGFEASQIFYEQYFL